MADLTDGARKIMRQLKQLDYRHGDYFPAGRLSYIFDDPEEKKRSIDELVAHNLVVIAPNGALGITVAGEQWSDADGSTAA